MENFIKILEKFDFCAVSLVYRNSNVIYTVDKNNVIKTLTFCILRSEGEDNPSIEIIGVKNGVFDVINIDHVKDKLSEIKEKFTKDYHDGVSWFEKDQEFHSRDIDFMVR